MLNLSTYGPHMTSHVLYLLQSGNYNVQEHKNQLCASVVKVPLQMKPVWNVKPGQAPSVN